MEKQILIGVMLLAFIPGAIYAMPNDYYTPEPIESLKVLFPTIGKSWHDITIFVNVCDARFNPNCEYGNRRAAMEYVSYSVDIHEINHDTKELTFIESFESKTNRLGSYANPILLDGKYIDKTQYRITVSTDDDVKTGDFWVYTKRY